MLETSGYFAYNGQEKDRKVGIEDVLTRMGIWVSILVMLQFMVSLRCLTTFLRIQFVYSFKTMIKFKCNFKHYRLMKFKLFMPYK